MCGVRAARAGLSRAEPKSPPYRLSSLTLFSGAPPLARGRVPVGSGRVSPFFLRLRLRADRVIPLAAFSLPLASPGLADGQGFSAALRCNPKPKERVMSKTRRVPAKTQKPAKKRARAGRLPRRDQSRKIIERLQWRDVTLSVSYEPKWLYPAGGFSLSAPAQLEGKK